MRPVLPHTSTNKMLIRTVLTYDLVVVVMRKNQVPAVLPILSANQRTLSVLFMVNNPSGYDDWIQAVGRDRLFDVKSF